MAGPSPRRRITLPEIVCIDEPDVKLTDHRKKLTLLSTNRFIALIVKDTQVGIKLQGRSKMALFQRQAIRPVYIVQCQDLLAHAF